MLKSLDVRILGLSLISAALVAACSGGTGDVVASGPGPGGDEDPFVVVPGDGNPFTNTCEATVDCAQIGATCGVAVDTCGNEVNCDNGQQDGLETDVDCGGGGTGCSALCEQGRMCLNNSDCVNGLCFDERCCDVDCSGPCMDCATGTCEEVLLEEDPDTCVAPNACSDTAACLLATGQPCTTDAQCASDLCDIVGGVCF